MPTGPRSAPALRASREMQSSGLPRRQLMRRALGAGVGVLAAEWLGGTLGFAWSAASGESAKVRVGTLDDLLLAQPDLPIRDGFPAYVPAARAFVVLIDPDVGRWFPGSDATGDGTGLNVRALSQRCPHLGCRPNPCIEDFWLHCPCHQSRYDRLGTKVAGDAYGPAPRGMDRYAIQVDADGVLTIDTAKIVLGPLPVALGSPGVIPPLVARGCV